MASFGVQRFSEKHKFHGSSFPLRQELPPGFPMLTLAGEEEELPSGELDSVKVSRYFGPKARGTNPQFLHVHLGQEGK